MKYRPLIASLVAPILAIVPIVLLGVQEMQQPSFINGQPDDAPMRTFGVFLVALPVIYSVLVLFAAAMGNLLLALGLRSLPKFLAGVAFLAIVSGVALGLALGRTQFGVSDVLFSVGSIQNSEKIVR